MAAAVRANGVPVWTVYFDDEGHTFFRNAANNDYYFYAWMMFVDKYLIGDAPRSTAGPESKTPVATWADHRRERTSA